MRVPLIQHTQGVPGACFGAVMAANYHLQRTKTRKSRFLAEFIKSKSLRVGLVCLDLEVAHGVVPLRALSTIAVAPETFVAPLEAPISPALRFRWLPFSAVPAPPFFASARTI